jgi:threonine/homoserine/homoserine lactone efflux protein
LRALGLVGAALVGYLAVHTWQAATREVAAAPVSLSRAVAVNLANPTPWLFWLTVGTTRLAAASATGALDGLVFVVLFYAGLVGAKLLLAAAAGTGRHLIAGRGHVLVVRFSALLLGAAALSLAYDAIR